MRTRAALLLLFPFYCAEVSAATFIVTKTADTADGACDSDCSLREALTAANTTPGADLIRLSRTTYSLGAVLEVADDVTLRGNADRSEIDVQGHDRVLKVLPGINAELIDITLKNGLAQGRGGGVLNEGNLVLRRTWVLNSVLRAAEGGVVRGGGIYNSGVLRLLTGRVLDNIARDDAMLAGGRGGGIYNAAGAQLYLYDSDVSSNFTGLDDARGYGGGLYNEGQARIDRSFFGDNDPGDGEGSAIANRAGGSLGLFNSTLSGNGHDGAAGALANGTLAAASESAPKANVFNVTIADNNGGGLLNTGRLTLRNTIVAGNYTQDGHDRWYDAGRNCRNEGRGQINQYFSLIGADGNCPAAIAVPNNTVFETVLEPLTNLGGPTPVHPLRQGPYAIDTGDVICPAFDQRLARRPADGDGDGVEACDIGAMESGADE